MSPAALRLDRIACLRGDRLLFEDLTLALDPGEAACITGANGAGKSSLLRIAAGLLRPSAGTVSREGRIACAGEATALDERLPLGRALGFWAEIDGRGAEDIATVCVSTGIAHLVAVPVRLLSTGQRKRAALARVVVSGASIWLLDEPASGLDDDGLALLDAAIARHRASGGIAIVATHQPIVLADARPVAL